MIEPEMLGAGVPAKALRKLSKENIERAQKGTKSDVQNARFIRVKK